MSSLPDRAPSARSQRVPLPAYKATVVSLADTTSMENQCATKTDRSVLERIKKCLDRAHHPTTPELEAKAALYMAGRLMGQYNVSQSEVLATESPKTRQQYGGQSTVALRRTDNDLKKSVRHQAFVPDIQYAMKTFFDCKTYSAMKKTGLEITFYGIAGNTTAAAMAFEAAYNIIVEWARGKKGAGKKNSYCMGAAGELARRSDQERAREEQSIHQQEQRETNNDEMDTTGPSSFHPEGSMSSDNVSSELIDDDAAEDGRDADVDFKIEEVADHDMALADIDIDEAIQNLVKSEREAATPFVPEPSPTWTSQTQLTIFRQAASQIADEYLASQDTKLFKSRRRRNEIRDQEAYDSGVRDGKTIDVGRKRLEEENVCEIVPCSVDRQIMG